MLIKEAAEKLGISQRMLRHYETSGLMEVDRSENGYRFYSSHNLRRAERIRDFIAVGYSTREVRAMAACLSEGSAVACEGEVPQLLKKLESIDRMRADLELRRQAVLERLSSARKSQENNSRHLIEMKLPKRLD